MRIWLLKDGEPLPNDGANVRLLRTGLLANELVNKGHQVVWWTSSFEHAKKKFRTLNDEDLTINPRYIIKLLHGCGYKRNISFNRIFHNRVIAKKFLESSQNEARPDIILAALPTIELALAATKYGNEHNIPVVLDLRDMWPDIMVENMPKFLRPFARLALEWQFKAVKNACQNATAMIGITQGFLEWGLQYAKRKNNGYDAVFPLAYSNGEAENIYSKEEEDFWQKTGIISGADNFIIAYVGSINRSFKFGEVIKAVSRLDNSVKLVIAGLGPDLEKYKKLARNNPNIFFPGWLDKPKIRSLLARSNVCIAPYINRMDFLISIPNKIAEYLCAGLPILSRIGGTTGKLLKENNCGFVYGSIDELIGIVNQLRLDHTLCKSLAENAHVLYECEFVAEKVYANMCNYLENIVKGYLKPRV